ncbi:MAG: nuclear transport factor 2 family protein [Pseudomonadota bacterium]|nr:nuclear transport factor 2 family protein [Pseudomonadota bacterium]
MKSYASRYARTLWRTKLILDNAERRIIRQDCEALSIAYARAVDFRDYDQFVDLFVEEGTLEAGVRLQGKAAIEESIKRRPDELRSRHVLTNIFVNVINRDQANGISYLTLYRHVGPESTRPDPIVFDGPFGIGHYQDLFVRTRDGWRFKSRVLHMAFRRNDIPQSSVKSN